MRRLGLVLSLCSGGCFFEQEPSNDGPASSGPAVDDDTIPATPYCMDVRAWPTELVELEEEVLVLVNDARGRGANCGGRQFGPAQPLTMNGGLRCAARLHSSDMANRMFFDHVNPDGEDPFDRMENTGFRFAVAGENIAAGQRTPQEVMNGWLESPGHCENIMEPEFTHIGVGLYLGEDPTLPTFWTQTFATPL